MAKYITAFVTINDYNVSKEGLNYPNISLIKSDNHIEWAMEAPTPTYQGFCKLTLNDSSVVELEGSGELTIDIIGSYQSTAVSAEIGTLCTSIGAGAFTDCTSLTSVTISNSVTSIDDFAFRGCNGLTSIDIPSSVINIGKSDLTFENVPWWSAYSADTSNHYGNIIYINDVAYQATSTTITSCEFKEGTVSIGSHAFSGCTSLTSVTIPNSVTNIGVSAFRGCNGLTSIDIPSSVTNISNRAFYNCSSFTSVTVEPTTPPTLGNYVFDGTNNCLIYVPDESVNAYREASGWDSYASRITVNNS